MALRSARQLISSGQKTVWWNVCRVAQFQFSGDTNMWLLFRTSQVTWDWDFKPLCSSLSQHQKRPGKQAG